MKKFILIISFSCILFCCCNENKRMKNQQLESNQFQNKTNEIKQVEIGTISDSTKPLSLKEMKDIVENKYFRRIDTAIYYEYNGEKYIVALHDDESTTIYLLYEFGGTWQELNILEADHHLGDFLGISFVNIGNLIYLYYNYTANGNVIGGINFNVYDLTNKKLYELCFTGPIGYYEYLEEISDDLKKNTDVLNFLKQKVRESPLVVKDSDKEKDKNKYNYIKEWYIANDRIHYKVNNNLYVWYPIKTKEYTKNLLAGLEEDNISAKVESKKYLVVSVFKGEVIAFKKSNKKYIPLWVPENVYEWIDSLRMVKLNTVILVKNDIDLYELNIDELKVRAL